MKKKSKFLPFFTVKKNTEHAQSHISNHQFGILKKWPEFLWILCLKRHKTSKDNAYIVFYPMILPKITDLGNFTEELSPQSDFTNILVDK